MRLAINRHCPRYDLLTAALIVFLVPLAAADEPYESPPRQLPIEKLDGQARAKVLAALAGLIILCFAMIALTWLGARVTRRYMNPPQYKSERSKFAERGIDDWADKPLAGSEDNE